MYYYVVDLLHIRYSIYCCKTRVQNQLYKLLTALPVFQCTLNLMIRVRLEDTEIQTQHTHINTRRDFIVVMFRSKLTWSMGDEAINRLKKEGDSRFVFSFLYFHQITYNYVLYLGVYISRLVHSYSNTKSHPTSYSSCGRLLVQPLLPKYIKQFFLSDWHQTYATLTASSKKKTIGIDVQDSRVDLKCSKIRFQRLLNRKTKNS